MSNIYDIMFVHNVPAYIMTRKSYVLEIILELTTLGVESVVCDCLVSQMLISEPGSTHITSIFVPLLIQRVAR